MSALDIRALTKSYGGTRVLADLSLEIAQGEIFGIIGPSGCGKSTLLRCIDLLEDFESGFIEYGFAEPLKAEPGGVLRHTAAHPASEFVGPEHVRRNLGLVFQDLHLWSDRTVIQNLILAPSVVLGLDRQRCEERAAGLLDRFGLASRAASRVRDLSGGERQRIAVIRALMMEPKILLCDEVTAALDPVLAFEVLTMLRELRADGLAMVIVTHHLEFAAAVCDRVGFLAGVDSSRSRHPMTS